jgi:formamidopyrimidine-DNA glycosylase
VRRRRIERLSRRGKYLVWELSDEVFLLMHLRMTGTLLCDPPLEPAHTRVRIDLGHHRVLFVDPRRFGTGQLALGHDALERFFAARIGVEPLTSDFSVAHLRACALGRRAPIKAFLLDQRHVAGVGNIYADEALFRARIHPLRPAGSLRPKQYAQLHGALVETLTAGIDARGATIDDFRDPDGARGSFQDSFLVHRREGEPCPRCGTTVRKLVVGGRGTYVCERCQPKPRRRG